MPSQFDEISNKGRRPVAFPSYISAPFAATLPAW